MSQLSCFVLLILWSIYCCPTFCHIVCFTFLVPCCDVPYGFHIRTTCLVRVYPQMFVEANVLIILFVLLRIVVSIWVTWQVSYKKAVTAYPLRALVFSPEFWCGQCFSSFCFLCYFVCLRPVSCVPNVASVDGLSISDCPLFPSVYIWYLRDTNNVTQITKIFAIHYNIQHINWFEMNEVQWSCWPTVG